MLWSNVAVISEIPTPEDFARSSLTLLNLAWSVGMDIVRELDESDIDQWDADGDVTDEYWRQSQPALGNALALIQQGQEMALKGKIAAVSPYLLIGRDPRDWPRRCEREDASFSMFRTADATDLVKIHNTVCSPSLRLSEGFEAFFDEVRRQRNAIIHAGGAGRRVEVAELLLNVLLTNEYLHAGARWPERRRVHLENDRVSVAFSSDHVGYVMLKEFDIAARLLKPVENKRFFGLTRARRYLCPHCQYEARDSDELIPLAQLVPSDPSATLISCFVCGHTTSVARKACTKVSCRSNVICGESKWGAICLVFHSNQDRARDDAYHPPEGLFLGRQRVAD
jgi:hypothetical protein